MTVKGTEIFSRDGSVIVTTKSSSPNTFDPSDASTLIVLVCSDERDIRARATTPLTYRLSSSGSTEPT